MSPQVIDSLYAGFVAAKLAPYFATSETKLPPKLLLQTFLASKFLINLVFAAVRE